MEKRPKKTLLHYKNCIFVTLNRYFVKFSFNVWWKSCNYKPNSTFLPFFEFILCIISLLRIPKKDVALKQGCYVVASLCGCVVMWLCQVFFCVDWCYDVAHTTPPNLTNSLHYGTLHCTSLDYPALWHTICDSLHVTCDTLHVTCDMWHVVGGEHSLKISAL